MFTIRLAIEKYSEYSQDSSRAALIVIRRMTTVYRAVVKKGGASCSSIYLFVRGTHAHLGKRWIYRVINLRARVPRAPHDGRRRIYARCATHDAHTSLQESAGQFRPLAEVTCNEAVRKIACRDLTISRKYDDWILRLECVEYVVPFSNNIYYPMHRVLPNIVRIT